LPKQPVTDTLNLLLTNQNVDLQRQVTDLRRELEAAASENKMLWAALERPTVATLTDAQIQALAELTFNRIMQFPIKKEEKPA
jgi:hypothetical protein